MKTNKFPIEIDVCAPRVFDRILEVAVQMRAERQGRVAAEREESRRAIERNLAAHRMREEEAERKRDELDRKRALDKLHSRMLRDAAAALSDDSGSPTSR